MPTTKLENGFVNENSRQQIRLNDVTASDQQVYDSFESNPCRNSFLKKTSSNKIKSFWSSNLSIASTSSSTSSQNANKSGIKKLFRDLITRSPSPSAERNKQAFLKRSQTMRPHERRRVFNRSSSRNMNKPTTISQKSVQGPPNTQASNIYDKLFINKKLNATNTKIVKQIDEELSPYSHIYKDFAVDCLKPFFQIEKIEKIQFDPSFGDTVDQHGSIVHHKMSTENDEGNY